MILIWRGDGAWVPVTIIGVGIVIEVVAAIKILTTLLLPSAGTARIFGFDVERQTRQIRRIMNEDGSR